MKYMIYWTDNAGPGKDKFFKKAFEFNSDREALLKAVEIQEDEEFEPDDFKKYNDESLKDYLFDVNLDAGFPVVFWIKKGSKMIYDSEINVEDWKTL